VTDVGSTKARIARAADALQATRPVRFIGSHPMAGSEQSGYGVSRADLFEGATVIVTPTETVAPRTAKDASVFWESLGARVSVLDPESHDRVVAAISHLPHLAAYALVDQVHADALPFAARGFRDTTRIAASDPEVWREIFLTNRRALVSSLGAYRHALDRLESLVMADDDGAALRSALASIAGKRKALG
jgi:prephenate dehydrogenase